MALGALIFKLSKNCENKIKKQKWWFVLHISPVLNKEDTITVWQQG